jgi:CRP-like cAMP-binding protein
MADFKGILAAIEKNVPLNDVERAVLLSSLESRSLKSGDIIARSGEQHQHFIFVSMGCLMTYFTDSEGVERVLQFAMSSWWTGDLDSFYKHKKSCYTIRALVDSEILTMTVPAFENLLERVPKLEKYFRILFQNSLVAHGLRITEMNSYSAEERYESFRQRFPTLEQFVPQKYIASYLGVTPEFLSKVRRRLAHKS